MAQIKLAEYTFDNSVGDVMPSLTPNTITMTKEDRVGGTTTRRIVYIDDTTMPSKIVFGQYNSLLAVDYINMGSHITSCTQMFYRSSSLKSINTSNWDLPNVTSYERFVMGCSKLESIDFSFATRTKTVNFYRAFEALSTLHTITGMQGLTINQLVINITTLKKLDLTGTTMVHTNFNKMFNNCQNLTEIKGIENWDVSSVTDFGSMFNGCKSLTKLDLRNWVTSSATSFQNMFSGCTNLEILRVDNFDYKEKDSGGTVLNSMFENCAKLKQIFLPKLTNKGLGNFNRFCHGCSSLEYISMPNFVWGNCDSIDGAFYNCTSLKMLDLTTLDSSTFYNKRYGISGIIKNITCPVYYNSNICSSSDFTDIPNKKNLIDVKGRLMAVYDFNNTVTSTDVYPVLTGSTVTETIDTQGSESNITHRVIGVDVMPTAIKFNSIPGLLNVDYLAVTNATTSLHNLFSNCIKMSYVNTFGWDTQNVTTMETAFGMCSSLTELDLSSCNLQNLQYLYGTFSDCSNLETLHLPTTFTTKLISLGRIFWHCSKLSVVTGLSEIDTSKVSNFDKTFDGATSLMEIDLSKWNTSSATGSSGMFGGWTSDQIVYIHDTNWTIDVSSYNATFVRLLSTLLAKYTFDNSIGDCLPTITGITTSDYKISDIVNDTITTRLLSTDSDKVITKYNFSAILPTTQHNKSLLTLDYLKIDKNITQMNDMFQVCSNVTSINAENWDTSNVTNMAYMLQNCHKLTEVRGLGTWDTSKVTAMAAMFQNKVGNIKEIENWDVSSCKNFSYMFANGGINSELNLSNWQTKNLENCQNMFANSPFTSINLSGWNVPKLNNMSSMFAGAGANSKLLTVNMSNWTMETSANMNSMFYNNANLTSIDFTGSKMISSNLQQTFRSCTKLTSLDASGFDTSQCTTMQGVFENCLSLTLLNLSNFNTSKVTTMNSMFAGCSSLTSLDLSSFNTISVNNMNQMFISCQKLKTLNLSHFDTSNVVKMGGMFQYCSSLTSLDLSSFNTSSVKDIGYMFQYCSSLTSLDLSNFNVTNASLSFAFQNCNLKQIGLVYSNASSINKIAENLYASSNCDIYYYDADPSQLTPIEGVTFKKYVMPTTIQLPPHIQLHSLPDGTKDEVDIKTGILTRRLGKFVLDGSFASSWRVAVNSGNTVLERSLATKEPNLLTLINNYGFPKVLDKNNSITSIPIDTSLANTNSVSKKCPSLWMDSYFGNYFIRISIPNGVVNDKDQYDYSYNDANRWLNENPITIVYKLSTPTTEKLILNYNNSCDYGRILPTGMCDKYSVVDSMYTQTMTSILLDGENTWDAMEEMTNVIKFTATGTTVGVENLNMLGAGGLYCDNDLFPNINDDSDVPHCRVDEAGNKFYIYVDKEMLMSPDLIGWQIWLQANPFNLIYELAEHLTYVKPYEELDPTQARWEGMDCMRDGAISYHTNSSDNITMYPTLEYVAPSINNFEVTMLEPNTDYTIYAEGINANDTINLGGTDINFNNGTVVTSGDNQWLRIDDNDSFYNMVITKGDTTGEHVPYFEGMTSVENPKVEGLGTARIVNLTNNEYAYGTYMGQSGTGQDSFSGTPGTVSSFVYTLNYIPVTGGENLIIYGNDTTVDRVVLFDKDKVQISSNLVGVNSGASNNPRTLYLSPEVCYMRFLIADDRFKEDINLAKDNVGHFNFYYGEPNDEYNNKPYQQSKVSYTDLKLRSLPNGVKDTINVVTGEYIQRVGEITFDGSEDWILTSDENDLTIRFALSLPLSKPTNIICEQFKVEHTYGKEYECIQLTDNKTLVVRISKEKATTLEMLKQWLSQNPMTVQYELAEPIITKLDPQTLLAYTDGAINLSSDTGLLPTTHYTVPSTNTFHLPSMKTGTRYTLKYPSASGSITIGDITYKISSDSMLFTTPLKINGDTSAIIFSDTNPENVVLLEGAYNKREVPFFTGVKSVKNPNITITDQLSTESTTYNCETEIELRGLPNGVADKLDIIKGKLTTNVGIRPYQEGDENLPNIWTDGYETVYALSSPVVKDVIIDRPTVTTNSLIALTSDYLIPQLNYRAPSSNNFPLDLLQPNTTYTLYADTLVSGSYTLGGTKTGIYSQPHTITLGDMTDNLLTFNGDLGLSNVMLVKGNSLKTSLPPYFLGIRSVTDGHLLVEGMAGEINEITFDEGIVLRDCNGTKDTIDLITCTLTKRTGEITLTGAEGWYRADSESTTDYNVFKLTLGGLKEALVMCDTLQSVFDTKMMDCIHAHANELCIVIANATIGGNTVNALKSWLNQHPTTVVYQLRVPIEVQLENTWTTTPPTSYDNQTEISSTVSTNSLKPMISVTIATTTLEEIVSDLEARNTRLEEENLATMIALTEVYEMMYTSTVDDDTEPTSVSTWNRRIIVSGIGMVYAKLVKRGVKSIEEVPTKLKIEVQYAIDNGLV